MGFMKRIAAFLIVAVSVSMLHAAVDFSVEVQGGMRYGMVQEIVYYGNYDLMSRLDWDQKPSPFLGVEAGMDIQRFSLALAVSLGFPLRTGQMEDFDWLNTDHSVLTHYSIHEAYLDKDFSAQAKLSYRMVDSDGFDVAPVLGISYRNRLWRGENGYGQYQDKINGEYPAWHEDVEKSYFTGTVISYEQLIIHPSVGLAMGWTLKNDWNIALAGDWFPYIWVDALDNHYRGTDKEPYGLQFRDIMNRGMGWGAEGTVGIPLDSRKNGKHLNITIGYEYFNVRGPSYDRPINSSDWGYPNGTSGTISSLWTIALGLEF